MMEGYKCHWCQYRKGCCPYDDIIPYCKEFKTGKCYSCKYYHGKDGTFTEKETEQWFKRGCEVWVPTSLFCNKRKHISRKRKKRLKKRGLWKL